MIETFLEELKGPSPGMAGGLAAITTGAAGAALFTKCRYSQGEKTMGLLSQLALSDGRVFENYLKAKRAGEESQSWLREATLTPLQAAEAALELVEQLPEARATCPKPMTADLRVAARLLETSARCSIELVQANIKLFDTPWEEAKTRIQIVCSRLAERDSYRRIFEETRTVAVVGISDSEEKPAYYVPSYLKKQGCRIWGVHPRGENSMADHTVTRLSELEAVPDLVLIFRDPTKVSEHLEEILNLSPPVVWLQLGITNESFAGTLQENNIHIVSDRCAMIEHQKLFI